MRHVLLTVVVVSLIAFGGAAGPAYADCPGDIQAVEERLESLTGRKKQMSFAVEAVNDLLDKAKAAWSAGKRKKCKKLVRKANEKFDEKLK